MTKMPQVSVVIIGRNEGERLEACIQSVQAIYVPQHSIEIIYVDSNSTDGSPARAQALGTRVLTVNPARPAAAIGRNAGWQAASAPYVLFLDGDTLLHPEFVNKALEVMADDENIAIVWGHRRESFPNASLYQRVLDLDWVYPAGDSEFCGGDALMRRDVLKAVQGYNEELIAGEEPEMCQRIRALDYRIAHIDEPMTLHDLAITRWSQYWRRATRAGHAYAEISQRLKETDTPLWQKDARKNLINAGVLSSTALLSLLGSFAIDSYLPVLAYIGAFLLLSMRTAWKVRWKSFQYTTLFYYGIHSQFQHIPIAVGQLRYYWQRWRGKRQGLIEYK